MISPKKSLTAAFLLGISLAHGAEVTKEQIPEIPKKLRIYLIEHQGNGGKMLIKDSPEQSFLYTYIREIESALTKDSSQEKADALKALNVDKSKEFQSKIQDKNFKDDQDFKNIFEAFLQISTGIENTLREGPSITLTLAGNTANNVGQVLDIGTDEFLAQSMGLKAPKNETERNILHFAAKIHKPVDTFGNQGTPLFLETIGNLTMISSGIHHDVEEASLPYAQLLDKSITYYRTILMARKISSHEEAKDITKSLAILRNISGGESLKETAKEPTIFDKLDEALTKWDTVADRNTRSAKHLLKLLADAREFTETQIATLGEKTYQEFIAKTNAVQQEIERYQLRESMRVDGDSPEMFNGLLPSPFPAIALCEKNIETIERLLSEWKKNPTQDNLAMLTAATKIIKLTSPEIEQEMRGENENQAKEMYQTISSRYDSVLAEIAHYTAYINEYHKKLAEYQDLVDRLTAMNPLKLQKKDIEIQNDRSEETSTAYRKLIEKGVYVNERDLKALEAKMNTATQKSLIIKDSWNKNIQNLAGAILRSSADFDRAYQSMAHSDIDKHVDEYFSGKDLFLEKLQEFYEETSGGGLSKNEVSTIIAELKNMSKKVEIDGYEELQPIFTNMQKRVEQIPIVEEKLNAGVRTGAILGLLGILAAVLVAAKKGKRQNGSGQLEVERGIIKPGLGFSPQDETKSVIKNKIKTPAKHIHLVDIVTTVETLKEETDQYGKDDLEKDSAGFVIQKVIQYLTMLYDSDGSSDNMKEFASNLLKGRGYTIGGLSILENSYGVITKATERAQFYQECVRRSNNT